MQKRLVAALALALPAALVLSACSDSSWTGEWAIKDVSTPMTGSGANPLGDAMLGEKVELSRSKVVMPHYTKKTERMVIPIERMVPDSENDVDGVVLHPSEKGRHVDSTIALAPQEDGTLILHGYLPRSGASPPFFLTLERR